MQILLQIAVLIAVQKLARFRGFPVNERRIRASFCPIEIFPEPCERRLNL